MRRIVPAQHRRMPWRNGGGTTSEIVVEPAELSAGDRFVYRVSIAEVARDGPFSRFEGYDRHIVLLEGAGMTLDCEGQGRMDLRRLEPRSFSGGWSVVGTLRAGPVRDFNLIVDHARAASSLGVRRLGDGQRVESRREETSIVHVVEGTLEGADAGDTLVFDGPYEIAARAVTVVAIARVTQHH